MDFLPNFVGVIPTAHITAIVMMNEALKSIDVTAHENYAVAIAGREEYQVNDEEYARAVEYYVHETAIRVIGMHGIKFSEQERTTTETATILKALLAIAEPHNGDLTESAIDLYQDAHELFCNLVSEIADIPVNRMYELIDYVDVDLITRIRNNLNDFDLDVEDDEVSEDLVAEYKEYMKDREMGVVVQSLQNVDRLPVSFNALVVDLQSQFKTFSPEDLVEQLYQVAIISNTKTRFVENVNNVLTAFDKDAMFVNDVNHELLKRGYEVDVL